MREVSQAVVGTGAGAGQRQVPEDVTRQRIPLPRPTSLALPFVNDDIWLMRAVCTAVEPKAIAKFQIFPRLRGPVNGPIQESVNSLGTGIKSKVGTLLYVF